jgi:hypothetical protein
MSALRRRVPAWVRSLLALIVALTVLRVVDWAVAPAPPAEVAAEAPPDLRRWDYIGCYDLEVDPWSFSRYVASSDSAARALLTAPSRVMLLPDSLDEWGRAYGTSRAAPLSGDHDERLARSLRWFVRADTLWLVWAAGATRVGVALFADGDSLTGRAISLRADSAQGTAAAGAWKINCSTFERDGALARPRR